MFTKAGEYGIKATLFIAYSSINNERVSLKTISENIGSPQAFTAKILQQLVKSKIINSTKGPHGGFNISEEMLDKKTLLHIVEALEGELNLSRCALGMEACNSDKPCPIHDNFVIVRRNLRIILEKSTLRTMAISLDKGESFLKI